MPAAYRTENLKHNSKNYMTVLSDGQQAKDRIADNPPGILFLEDMLRNVDGYELLAFLFHRPVQLKTKAIFAMRRPNDGDPMPDWSLPVESYVAMPYDPWQVLFSIEQLIHRAILSS